MGRPLILVALLAIVGCAPEPPPEWSCFALEGERGACGERAHVTCPDGDEGEAICECDDGYVRPSDGAPTCVLEDIHPCCECLATHYYISDSTTTDNRLDKLCVPSEDQCVMALERGASISTYQGCTTHTCAGSCWFLR